MDRTYTIRVRARWVRYALVALVTALVALPVGALAGHQFPDVPDDSIFHGDIAAIADAEVTLGFPDGTFRPKDFVTREQMAAFLNRGLALAPDKTPVANADKVDGRDANQLLRVASGQTDDAPNQNGAIVSATISAPTAGWLIITGGVDAGGTDAFTCFLTVGENQVVGSVRFAGNEAQATEENCETTGVHQVAAGDHTIALQIGAQATALFGNASLWALFVPFDSEGNPAG
jgi:hypothetical protein